VTVLVHNVRLMHIALTLLYAPQLVSQLLFGGSGRWGPTLTILAYLIYIAAQGKKLSQAYWRQIEDNYDLATIARRDYLTSLPNRLFMEELLETTITGARRSGGQLALLYIDLDGFKQINDRFSHRIGDLFLCEVARRLSAGIQSKGVAARLGGDEFSILVTECPSKDAAVEIAERIVRLAREPLLIEGHTLCFSASIGVSLFPRDASAADHLVRAADHAMYAAKNSGKNRVCFFEAIRDETNFSRELNRCSLRSPNVTIGVA
jgi:diguanylate cyclase (GGDEF)-like protein